MNLRAALIEARALVAKGWCQSYLAVTADGEPTSHVGHEQAFPAGAKVSKNAVFLREEVRKGEEEGEKPKTFNVYSFPPVKWSLLGALLKVSGSPSCGYPNETASKLFREFEPFYREWDFEFGTRRFTYLSAFNDHSETRTEIDETTGKKKKITEATTVEEVIRLIDCAIARIDLREGNARVAKVVADRGYELDPRIAEAMSKRQPYIDQSVPIPCGPETGGWTGSAIQRAIAKIKLNSELPLVGGPAVFYDAELAAKITETGREMVRLLDESTNKMGRTLDEVMNSLPPERREKIEKRVAELEGPRATIAPITSRADLGDNLSVYEVLGHAVVGMKEDGKHRFEVGELVVYVPDNMIVPEVHLRDRGYWNEAKGVGLLGGSKGNRVKPRAFMKTPENPEGTVSVGLIWKTETYLRSQEPRCRVVSRVLVEGEDLSVFDDTFQTSSERVGMKIVQEGDDVTDFFDLKPAA